MKDTDKLREIQHTDFFNCSSSLEQTQFLLQYAVLSPSTHNSQPWQFTIHENYCDILIDKSVQITEADPLQRDLYISLGCLIKNFKIAAECFQVFDKVIYGNHESASFVARIFLKKQTVNSISNPKLLEAIIKRANVRGPFQDKNIPSSVISEIQNILKIELTHKLTCHIIQDKNKIIKLAALTAKGLQIAYKNKSFRKEMAQWINSNFSKKLTGLPGYALKMPSIVSLILPKIIPLVDIGSKLADLNFKALSSASLICMISAEENNYQTWISVGELAQRIMLEFQTSNISCSVYVAAIEIGDLYKEVQNIVDTKLIPQFLFSVGYTTEPFRFTPRIPVIDKIIK